MIQRDNLVPVPIRRLATSAGRTVLQAAMVGMMVALLVALAACSAIDTGTAAGPSDAQPLAPALAAPGVTSIPAPEPSTVATSIPAPTATTFPTATPVPSPTPIPTPNPLPGSVIFSDPEGLYQLSIDPSWVPAPPPQPLMESWFVGPEADDFVPTINTFTEDVSGFDLTGYLDLSIANAPLFHTNFSLIDTQTFTAASGQMLAVMEYTGSGLHYLSIFGVQETQAVNVTLSATDAQFAALRSELEPYMVSLRLGVVRA